MNKNIFIFFKKSIDILLNIEYNKVVIKQVIFILKILITVSWAPLMWQFLNSKRKTADHRSAVFVCQTKIAFLNKQKSFIFLEEFSWQKKILWYNIIKIRKHQCSFIYFVHSIKLPTKRPANRWGVLLSHHFFIHFLKISKKETIKTRLIFPFLSKKF